VPGVQVAAFGPAGALRAVDGASGVPGLVLTADVPGQAGSLAKPVTAMVVAALVAEGVITLEEDLRPLLSEAGSVPVTLADLLGHTAGAGVHGFLGAGPGEAPDDPVDVATVALRDRRAPNGPYAYAGGGYAAVQVALERRTGRTLEAMAAERVLGPGGALPAALSVLAPTPPMAGHWQEEPLPGGSRTQAVLAAAGLWASADALLALIVAMQASLAGRAGAVLPAGPAAQLVTPRTRGDDGELVGLGWLLDAARPGWFFHPGRTVGYAALALGHVDGHAAAAVLANGLPGGPRLCRAVAGWALRAVGAAPPEGVVGLPLGVNAG
jgi:CubicO group peptidase (beta-lactamase class C family)